MLVNSHTRHAFFLFLLSLQLAKKYHPDLNPNAKEESQSKMTELVQAYQRLTSDDYNDAHDSQVALVCEILPLEELGRNPNYDVYAIRVWLWGDDDSSPLTTTIKSNAAALGIKDDIFDRYNVHIHVPEGATPKDGPSAGITMLTSLVSLFTQRKVKKSLAMTGEITLRGKVLPVGGIKEKILAAKRARIKEIILCEDNRRDVEEIKQDYLKGVQFHYVKEMGEVIDMALLKQKVSGAKQL